jgi:hypothetical protein
MSTGLEIEMKAAAAARVVFKMAHDLGLRQTRTVYPIVWWRITLIIVGERAQRQLTYTPKS